MEHTWKACRRKTREGDAKGEKKMCYWKTRGVPNVKFLRSNCKIGSGLSGISTKNQYKECSERSEWWSCRSKKTQQAVACCGTISQLFGHEQNLFTLLVNEHSAAEREVPGSNPGAPWFLIFFFFAFLTLTKEIFKILMKIHAKITIIIEENREPYYFIIICKCK